MADIYKKVIKQNITDLIYETTLINNTDLQQSIALSNLMGGIFETSYNTPTEVQDAITAGTITPDTYVFANGIAFAPRNRFVDTAGNIVKTFL